MNQMDNTGAVLQGSDSTGVIVANSTNTNTNYAALSAITVGSLQSTSGYAADLLPTQATGPFFNRQDDIDHSGEAVFDGVGTGDGFAFGSAGTLGLSSVDAGLFGAGEFEGFGHG